MPHSFSSRADGPERMDIETLSLHDTEKILTALERINRWLGGVHATLSPLKEFSKRWKPGETIRIVDWGTGGADIPRALVQWARKNGFVFEIVGIDNNPEVIEVAKKLCKDYPEIRFVRAHLFAYPENETFDYAISSLCLHHLTEPVITELFKKSDRMAQRGIIMNDLIRSRRAWAWIWALTRLGHSHPIVQYDAPLSVRRAFGRGELESLARKAGVSYLSEKRHFGYRVTLSGEKN